jgi:hypothetical protein
MCVFSVNYDVSFLPAFSLLLLRAAIVGSRLPQQQQRSFSKKKTSEKAPVVFPGRLGYRLHPLGSWEHAGSRFVRVAAADRVV